MGRALPPNSWPPAEKGTGRRGSHRPALSLEVEGQAPTPTPTPTLRPSSVFSFNVKFGVAYYSMIRLKPAIFSQ